MGWAIDWDARDLDPRSALLPLDAVALPALLRAAGSPTARMRRSTGARTTRPCSRTSRCSPTATASAAAREVESRVTGAVVLQDHRLRRRAARRPRDRRLARADQGVPAQLDRPLRGRRDRSSAIEELGRGRPVFTTRPDTLFGATFFVLAPEHQLVRSGSSRTRCRRTCATRLGEEDRGARRGGREDRRLHRPARGQPGQRRADPDLGRRLRADGLRHRRDHGRARPRRARLRLRAGVRPARAPGDPAGGGRRRSCRTSRTRRTSVLVNSGEFDGLPAPEGEARRSSSRSRRTGAAEFAVNYRLRDWGFSRQRYWGCPIPIVYCETAGSCRCPTTSCRSCCPRSRTTSRRASRRSPQAEDWVHDDLPALRRRGAARDGDDGHVRRLRPGTSSATATRTTTARRSTARAVDYWNPVDLYIGGVDHATMHLIYARFLMKVLNDLGSSASGSRSRASSQRLGHDGREEDVEAIRATSSGPDAVDRALRRGRRSGSTSSSSARPTRTWSGRTRAIEGIVALRPQAVAGRARGRRERAGRRAGRRPARAEGARDDREGDGRHRPALRVQHAHLGRDGARRTSSPATRAARTRASPPRPLSR